MGPRRKRNRVEKIGTTGRPGRREGGQGGTNGGDGRINRGRRVKVGERIEIEMLRLAIWGSL